MHDHVVAGAAVAWPAGLSRGTATGALWRVGVRAASVASRVCAVAVHQQAVR